MEKYDRSDNPEHSQRFWSNRYLYTPNGQLCLILNVSLYSNTKRRWCDGQRPLEDSIDELIAILPRVVEELRTQRQAREEQHRRWEEERLAQAREQARQEAARRRMVELQEQAIAWRRSQDLREYLAACDVALSALAVKPETQQEWLAWAGQVADFLNPLKNGQLVALVDAWAVDAKRED